MSLLVVIGTILPLVADHKDDAGSPAALVTMAGLLFAISGFVTSGTVCNLDSARGPLSMSQRLSTLSWAIEYLAVCHNKRSSGHGVRPQCSTRSGYVLARIGHAIVSHN